MNKPRIGAFVLETLTTGMYINPLDAIREFVQNGTDSIREAETSGIIAKGAGRIEIEISPQTRTLIIRDNGTGLSKDLAFQDLTNIGMSRKKYDKNTGFRGIGRLAGIAYCKTLKFRTSSKKEKVQSIIEINCVELKGMISPSFKEVDELSEVLSKCSSVSIEPAGREDHFFEVCMEGIDDDANEFMDYQALEEYLSQVAPVGFDAQRFIYAPIINKWLKANSVYFDTMTLVIKAPGIEREVFKPYKSRYKTRGSKGGDNYEVQIKDVVIFPETIDETTDFWGWYGKTDLLGMLDDERAAGFRLRKNNFALGKSERMDEIFALTAKSNARFNSYYIGEVHIINKSAIPNARRDGFEDGGAWPDIKTKLRSFAKDRSDEIRTTSQERNKPTEKVITTVQKVLNDSNDRIEKGLASPKERDFLLEKIKKEENRLQISIESRENSKDQKDQVDIKKLKDLRVQLKSVKNKLSDDNNFAINNFKSSLDRKQRKVLEDVLHILLETLDPKEYKKARDAILDRFSHKGIQKDG